MKKLILFVLTLLFVQSVYAQITTSPQTVIEEKMDDDKIYTFVQKKPEFVTGEEGLLEFISNNLVYPESAREDGIEGVVVMRFIIMKDGAIKDIKVIRSLDKECDAEALKLIQSMPNWEPAKHNGKKVNCTYTLPINFKLDKD